MWVSRRKPLDAVDPDTDNPMDSRGPVVISLPPADDKRDHPSSGSGNSLVTSSQEGVGMNYDIPPVPQLSSEYNTSSMPEHDSKAERERELYQKEIMEREARKRVKKRTTSVPMIPFDEVHTIMHKSSTFDRDGSSTPSLDLRRGPFTDSCVSGRQTPLQYDSDAVLITTRAPKSRTRRLHPGHDGNHSSKESEQEELDVAQAISKLRTLKSNQLR